MSAAAVTMAVLGTLLLFGGQALAYVRSWRRHLSSSERLTAVALIVAGLTLLVAGLIVDHDRTRQNDRAAQRQQLAGYRAQLERLGCPQLARDLPRAAASAEQPPGQAYLVYRGACLAARTSTSSN